MLGAFISSPSLPSSWNELYLMLGSSSAVLIGLLFVATSLHLAEIANEDIYRLRAEYTMLSLLSTLLQGAAVLIPQPITVLGVELLAVNLWGLSVKGDQNSGLTRSWWLLGPPRDLERDCVPERAAQRLLERAASQLGLSARACHRCLRLARSIADLADAETIAVTHIGEALSLRCLDRRPNS